MKFNFPKKKKVFLKEETVIYPRRFWKVVLVVSFLGILSSFAFGGFMYFKISKDFHYTEEELGISLNKFFPLRLDQMISSIKTREVKSLEIVQFPPPVIDPSL